MITDGQKAEHKRTILEFLNKWKAIDYWQPVVESLNSMNAFCFGYSKGPMYLSYLYIDYDAMNKDGLNNRPFLDVEEHITKMYPEWLREKEINDYFKEMINEG